MKYEDIQIIEAMESQGGGFVQSLAACFRKADHINFEKLKNAFPEYWERYKNLSCG